MRNRLAFLALAAAACSGGGGPGGGGGTGPERRPTTIVLTRGGDQFGAAGTALPGQVGVTVSDGRGTMPGVTVQFAVTEGGGTIDQTSVVTNERGEAGVLWTVGQKAGVQTLTATVPPLNPVTVHATAVAGPASKIIPVEGTGQFGVVRRPVATRPVVLVTDQFDNPTANVSVVFAPAGGGGSIAGAEQTTTTAGRATLGGWTLGPRAGPNAVSAEAGGLFVLFEATGTAAAVVPVTPVDQAANVGTPAPAVPVVEARDDEGRPLSGVPIEFAVVAGGGVVTGARTETNAAGRAHPSSWVLGQVPGANRLAARNPGGPEASFLATGVAAQPVGLSVVRGHGQQGYLGNVTAELPTVRLVDVLGKPVAGQAVSFEVSSGDGRIARATTTSDPSGEASLGGWRLGPTAGLHQVRATAAGLPPVTFSATAGASPASLFTIDLRFNGSPTTEQQAAFAAAAAHWSRLIVGDVRDVPIAFGQDPAGCYPDLHETIDDLAIYISIEAIDGPGGILGAAGACLARDDDLLPVVGIMIVDQSDMAELARRGILEATITHEIGHVLGFGPLVWGLKGLIIGEGSDDPLFIGPSARGAYALAAGPGSVFSRGSVPLENAGGRGTRDSHWRESVFDTELMTGIADDGSNPLSAITAASLRDIGYAVNDAVADDYTFLAAVRAVAAGRIPIPHSIPWGGPLRLVGRRGEVVRTLR